MHQTTHQVTGTELAAEWARWKSSDAYTLGVEEEVMVLDPSDWALAHRGEDVLSFLSSALSSSVTAETHEAAIELSTGVHHTAAGAAEEATRLRGALASELADHGLRAAGAGTHPLAQWHETRVSRGARYQLIYEAMRELARREPTFALHVHVGVTDAEAASELYNRMRAHLPLLLALSANSPFWQGRASGLASSRTSIFKAFPRVGIPRAFAGYEEHVEAIDQLLRCDAFPEPTFLWWDVRLQPRFGTVEVRVMDVQSDPGDTAALVALVQSIAHLELEEGYASEPLLHATELLEENRFLAARDGMDAQLIDPLRERRVPARQLLGELLVAAYPHAEELGCESVLDGVESLARQTGAARQLSLARGCSLRELVQQLSSRFVWPGGL